jgi:hypothetical protein
VRVDRCIFALLCGFQLPETQKIDKSPAMEELFGDPAYKGFVLQDHKRLPSRFFARIVGAPTSRLSRA